MFVTAQIAAAASRRVRDVAPIVRGACSLKDDGGEGAHRRMILEFRTSDAILNFVNGAELARYGAAGVITPDHTIRTKNWPLILPAPEAGKLGRLQRARRQKPRPPSSRTTSSISRATTRASAAARRMVDPLPRVVLVPGLGLFGLGRSAKDARIAADLAEAAVATITDAEAIGRFESISEADMFDCEYWPIEQAKLGSGQGMPLAGQIAVVTGAGGAIGAATAKAFAAAGAEVALLDVELRPRPARRPRPIGGAALARACDVTDAASVRDAFAQVVDAFGGVDIVVSNAGAAWQGRIGEVDEAIAAQELRAEFLRPPARGAGGGEDHAGAGHRRLPAVQRVEAGGQSGPEFRPLRPAEGGDAVAGAAIRASTTAPTASAPTRSTPTASARACSPTTSSRSARRRAACARRTT